MRYSMSRASGSRPFTSRSLADVLDRLENSGRGKNAVEPSLTEYNRLGIVDRLQGAVRELLRGKIRTQSQLNVEVADDEVDRGLFRHPAADSLIRRLSERECERRATVSDSAGSRMASCSTVHRCARITGL